jgi:methylmalonyl-CoA epimerase
MITKLDHIAIAVADIDEASRFYTEMLGLEVTGIEELPKEKVKVAFIPIGDTRLELVQPLTEDSPISKFLEKRGQGLHHLCFQSDDIDKDVQVLVDSEARMLDKEARAGSHNSRIAFVHPKTNSGVLTELSQPADDH